MILIIRGVAAFRVLRFKVATVGMRNPYGVTVYAKVSTMPLERNNICPHALYSIVVARKRWLLLYFMRQALNVPTLGRWAPRKSVEGIASSGPRKWGMR